MSCVQTVAMSPALEAIRKEADRLGWPQAFRGDLGHDAEAIGKRDSSRPFLWSIRDSGTHLIYVDCPWDRSWAKACASQGKGPDRERYYVWDGEELNPIGSGERWAELAGDMLEELPRWAVHLTAVYPFWPPSEKTGTRHVRAIDEDTARGYAVSQATGIFPAGYRDIRAAVVPCES